MAEIQARGPGGGDRVAKPLAVGYGKILFGLLTIVLAPIAEEALFRGILYPSIKQTGHPRWALWGTSLLFGIMHFNMATLVPLVFWRCSCFVLRIIRQSADAHRDPQHV